MPTIDALLMYDRPQAAKENHMATKKAAAETATKTNTKNKGAAHDPESSDVIDIQAELDELDDDSWDETEKKELGGDLPDGRYQVVIENVTINRSKNAKNPRLQASFEFKVLCDITGDTAQRNRKSWTHFGLEDDEQRGYLRGSLAKLGVEWPKKAELAQTLEDLKGSFAQINCKTKKKRDKDTGELTDQTNTYIDKALDEGDVHQVLDVDPEAENVDVDPEADAEPVATVTTKKPTAKKKPDEPEAEAEVTDDEVADEAAEEALGTDDEEVVADDEEVVADEEEAVEEENTDVVINIKAFKKSQVDKIETLAKTLKFNPADYTKKADLLGDIAENVGIAGGEYTDVDTVIALIEAKMPKAKPKK